MIRRPLRQRVVWVLAAAAVFAAVIVGVLLIQPDSTGGSGRHTDAAQLYAELEALPAALRYDVVPGEVDGAVAGSLVVSPDGGQAVLRVSYLPPITSDQTFQMWLIDDSGARTSGGVFQADTSRDALYIRVPFDRPLAAYRGVGVSLEPAGGSPYEDQPTGPRVLSVPLE